MSETSQVVRPPLSVTRASQVVCLLVAVATVVVVLAVVLDDETIAAWVGGQGRSPDDTRVPPSFTPVVVVLYVVISTLLLILLTFLRAGHDWARHAIAAGAGLVLIAGSSGLRTGPPAPFLACTIAVLALAVVLLVLLYLPSTSAWVGRIERPSDSPTAPPVS